MTCSLTFFGKSFVRSWTFLLMCLPRTIFLNLKNLLCFLNAQQRWSPLLYSPSEFHSFSIRITWIVELMAPNKFTLNYYYIFFFFGKSFDVINPSIITCITCIAGRLNLNMICFYVNYVTALLRYRPSVGCNKQRELMKYHVSD